MSDRVRIFLFFGLLVAFGIVFKVWVIPYIDKTTGQRTQMIITAVCLALGMSLFTFLLYLFWSYWDPVSWWTKALRYLLGAGWITLLVALGVAMIKLIIWPPPAVPPQPVAQPRGIGVAIFGAVVLIISFAYLFILVTNKDSFGAERFLDFKVFMLWFVCGVYLIISSRVLDPVVGAVFEESFTKRLEHLAGSDPKYSLLVAVPALLLASVVAMWHNWRR